jgi:hypothetical protein
MANSLGEPVPIADLTLDGLVSLLIQGRSVAISGTTNVFSLAEKSQRALAFYKRDPRYWKANTPVSKAEIDQLLTTVGATGQRFTINVVPAKPKILRWHLRKVRAHRFAGLHRHCDPSTGQPPDQFEWTPLREASVIWGFNGAGKSSLLSAITWCLTGRAIRSNHLPSEIHEPIELIEPGSEPPEPTADDSVDGQKAIRLLPIVPIPSSRELAALSDQKLAQDTWVELDLESSENGPITIRRALRTTNSGKLRVEVAGISDLHLPDLALHVGTIMPAIAAQMRFDEPTELGRAVAELTGLKPFADFGTRTKRVIERLTKKERQDTEAKRSELLERFRERLDHWNDIATQALLEVEHDLILPTEEMQPNCLARLQAARVQANNSRAAAIDCLKDILGVDPPLNDDNAVAKLLGTISNALSLLTGAELRQLPTVQQKLGPLKSLSDRPDEIANLETLILSTLSDGKLLAAELANIEQSRRWQLYARVAQWHEEHHPGRPLERCPVCATELASVPRDALLDKSIREALDECRNASLHSAKSAEEWEKDRAISIRASLSANVVSLIEVDWRNGLGPLLESALFRELFAKAEFKGVLLPLHANARGIFDQLLASLPPWSVPESEELPDLFSGGELRLLLRKLALLVGISRYRRDHGPMLDDILLSVIGKKPAEEVPAERLSQPLARKSLPIKEQLSLMQLAAAAARPAAKAIEVIDGLMNIHRNWDTEGKRLILLAEAAVAVQPFQNFPEIVREQVSGIIKELADQTGAWASAIYRPQYTGGPIFAGVGETQDASLKLLASFGSLTAPAHEVLNASALRAFVWAFLFALWKRIWVTRGGTSILLLDDPQALFDFLNAENFAGAVPGLIREEMRPIITSNDAHFVVSTYAGISAARLADKLSMLQLSPISQSKLTASVIERIEDVREAKQSWELDEGNTSKAQDFVIRVRSHIETRLWDLLASDLFPLHKPALSDLIGRLAHMRKTGQLPFNEPPFERILSHQALRPGAPFYEIIQKAAHRPRDITPEDAKRIAEQFNSVEEAIDACANAFARFMNRSVDTRFDATSEGTPVLPPCEPLNLAPLLELEGLAARMDLTSLMSAEHKTARWEISSLGDVALYGIGSHSLGAACLLGQTAIVNPTVEASPGDLVIVLYGDHTFARRLATDRNDPARVILESVHSIPGRVPPTHIVPRHKARVMKIVGVLFDQHSSIRGEATQVSTSDALRSVKLIAPVIDQSAFPIAVDGSRVLLTPIGDTPTEAEVARLEGRLVAAVVSGSTDATGDCSGFLKRLGESLPGYPAVRAFERIGLQGNSIHAHFPTLGKSPSSQIPHVRHWWRVSGVIFPS